jgi:N-acetylmuramoyl-L-alanine amidase
MPSVLIEVGFITNPTEARRLVSKTYQKHLAKGIADGIERYFIKNR